jgi:hypothetical protein
MAQVEETLITGYILRYSQPAQGVGWWLDEHNPAAAEALQLVLFEAENDSLHDLTQPNVRHAVLRAVLEHTALRAMVGAEVEGFVDAVASRLQVLNHSASEEECGDEARD